jgi:hypothetical protein
MLELKFIKKFYFKVTFCNLNPWNHDTAQGFINATLANNNLSYVQNINLIDMNPSLINNLLKSTLYAGINVTQNQSYNYGYTLDYMFLTCYFNSVPCNKSDFVYRYNYDMLNCFTVYA